MQYRKAKGKSAFTSSTLDSTLVVSHWVTLAGLSPRTTYEYRVLSRDAPGNVTPAAHRTFTTK